MCALVMLQGRTRQLCIWLGRSGQAELIRPGWRSGDTPLVNRSATSLHQSSCNLLSKAHLIYLSCHALFPLAGLRWCEPSPLHLQASIHYEHDSTLSVTNYVTGYLNRRGVREGIACTVKPYPLRGID
eukprot:745285-Pyramimonas_sp.AAC.2